LGCKTSGTVYGTFDGKTYICKDNATIPEDAIIRGFKVCLYSAGSVRLKIFRRNGTRWDFVGESELHSIGKGESDILPAEIKVLAGDYIGFYSTQSIEYNYVGSGESVYVDGDRSDSISDSELSTHSNAKPKIEVFYEPESTQPPEVTAVSWSPQTTNVKTILSGSTLVGTNEHLKVGSLSACTKKTPSVTLYILDTDYNVIKTLSVEEQSEFEFDGDTWIVLDLLRGKECDVARLAKKTADMHPYIGEEIQFKCSVDWHGSEQDKVIWYAAPAPDECFDDTDLSWEEIGRGLFPTYTFTDEDTATYFLRVVAINTDDERGSSPASMGLESVCGCQTICLSKPPSGFKITLSVPENTGEEGNLSVLKVYHIPFTNSYYNPPLVDQVVWKDAANGEYKAIGASANGCYDSCTPKPTFCDFPGDAGTYAISFGHETVAFYPEERVFTLEEGKITDVTITDNYLDFLESHLCSWLGISEAECSYFLATVVSDVAAAYELIKIFRDHENLAGEPVTPGAGEYIEGALIIFCAFIPGISGGGVSKTGAKLLSRFTELGRTDKKIAEWIANHNKELVAAAARMNDADTRLDDIYKALDEADFATASSKLSDILDNPSIEHSVMLTRLKAWANELIDKIKSPWSETSEDVIKKSKVGRGFAEEFAEGAVDHIDTIADLRKYAKEAVWDDIVEFDKNVWLNMDIFARPIKGSENLHPGGITLLDLYRVDALTTAGNAARLQKAGRLVNFEDYAIKAIKKDPAKYRKIVASCSDEEIETLLRDMKNIGRSTYPSIIKGLRKSGKWAETGGLFDGLDDVSKALKKAVEAEDVGEETGKVAKEAAAKIVDEAIDSIKPVADDASAFKKVDDAITNAPPKQKNILSTLQKEIREGIERAQGTPWDLMTASEKAVGYVKWSLRFGGACFMLFIGEEVLQRVGQSFYPTSQAIYGWERKTQEEKDDILEEYERALKVAETIFWLTVVLQSPFMIICFPFAPLYALYTIQSNSDLQGRKWEYERLKEDKNPAGGWKVYFWISANIDGVKVTINGHSYDKLAGTSADEFIAVFPEDAELKNYMIVGRKTGYIEDDVEVTLTSADIGWENSQEVHLELKPASNVPGYTHAKEQGIPTDPEVLDEEVGYDPDKIPEGWGGNVPNDEWFSGELTSDEVGDIICDTYPPDAAIWLDDKDTGLRTYDKLVSIPVGEHKITFKKDGYKDCDRYVTVDPITPARATCDLQESTGTVNCFCNRDNAKIWVKGGEYEDWHDTGRKTRKYGSTSLKLEEGSYYIKYTLLDVLGCTSPEPVVVRAGETIDYTECNTLELLPPLGPSVDTTVTEVCDGDTIRTEVTDGLEPLDPSSSVPCKRNQRIRFEDVNAPELGTPIGDATKEFLEDLLPVGTPVTLSIDPEFPLGYFNRVLAVVYKDGENINEAVKDFVKEKKKEEGEGAKGVWTIYQAVDADGNPVSKARIYVDDRYTHHYADDPPEDLEFCSGCWIGEAFCDFGKHTVEVRKGDLVWSKTRNIQPGDEVSDTPVLGEAPPSTVDNLCDWIKGLGGADNIGLYDLTLLIKAMNFDADIGFVPSLADYAGCIKYMNGEDGDSMTGCDFYPDTSGSAWRVSAEQVGGEDGFASRLLRLMSRAREL